MTSPRRETKGINPPGEETAPLISVVVCTYSRDRKAQLLATLESLRSQTYPNLEVVVVVDHNPDLAADLRATFTGGGTTVIENAGVRGLSSARNSGIEQSRGEIIAFIDDDATAEPGWLEGLSRLYKYEDVMAVGGGIKPAWQGGRPRWFPPELFWIVGCSYRGLPRGGPVRNVLGCNMSFRAGVLKEIGGFSDFVGREGAQVTGCDETELCIRTRQRWPDRQIIYAPEAEVHHHVPRERQTVSYVIRRSFSEGISKARTRRLTGGAALSSERSYLARTLGGALVRNTWRFLSRRGAGHALQQNAVISAAAVATAAGFVVEVIKSGPVAPSKAPTQHP